MLIIKYLFLSEKNVGFELEYHNASLGIIPESKHVRLKKKIGDDWIVGAEHGGRLSCARSCGTAKKTESSKA
ncbi:hypothetical protein L1887_18603 [Cichorium endivia]|nr:hypothetical protein L1887_18603 [Cichorium endivia]